MRDSATPRYLSVISSETRAVFAETPCRLAKYETWEEFTAAISSIGSAHPGGMEPKKYGQLRSQGAGRHIIAAFLGGNFKNWMVEQAHGQTAPGKTLSQKSDKTEPVDTIKEAATYAGVRMSGVADKMPLMGDKMSRVRQLVRAVELPLSRPFRAGR